MPSPLRHFLDRIWQIFGKDIGYVVIFAAVAGQSLLAGLAELGSAAWRRAIERLLRQTGKALGRGIIQIGLTGLVLRLGAQSLGKVTGTLARPLLESFVLLIFVRDILPLAVAGFLAVRQGASLTTKYAFPAASGAGDPDERLRDVAPSIASASLAGYVFFATLAWFFLGGYLAAGPLPQRLDLTAYDALLGATLRTGFILGSLKAALFGGIVVYVALALGWEAGKQARQADHLAHGHFAHYFVWEASSISLTACILLTVVLWQPLNGAIL